MAEGGESPKVTESSITAPILGKESNKDTKTEPTKASAEISSDDKRKKRHPPRHNRHYYHQYYYRPREYNDEWRHDRHYYKDRKGPRNGEKIQQKNATKESHTDMKPDSGNKSENSNKYNGEIPIQNNDKISVITSCKNDVHHSDKGSHTSSRHDSGKRRPYRYERRKERQEFRQEEVKGERGGGRYKDRKGKYGRQNEELKDRSEETKEKRETQEEEEKESEGKKKYIIHKQQDGTIKIEKEEEIKHSQHSRRKEIKKDKMISSTQSDELSQQLLSGVYECSVCCERVKHYQEVWSCKCCYHIFHLRCIRRWAHSLTAAANEEHPENGWRCPCCQNVSVTIPSAYTCFCGRVLNPSQSRKRGDLSVPHSCGEPCRKRLALTDESPCQHKCSQLCHPGRCPPCPVMVTRKCPCGKKSSRVRCSQYDELPSCDGICGKMLNCELHNCTQICHKGVCDKCQIEVEKRCFCGRDTQTMLCGQVNSFSCGKMCNKPLSCGNHTCEALCHEGMCSPCSLQPDTVTHCPCGATPISQLLPVDVVRTSCLDDVPLCDNKCSKPLPCSVYSNDSLHYCPKSCHTGPCPPCTLTSIVYCKCGKTHLKVSCTKADKEQGFSCNRTCGKKLSCAHHRCQTKCCVAETHTCERVCGRKHDCGRHSCQDTCHPGRCGPCWNISYEELTCHCGNEIMLPPISCGTVPPTCNRPCARVHSCNHPVAHTCHSEETCPPCTFLTDKMCMGNHILRNYIPCHLKDVSCGKPCGLPLKCGMHKCRKVCHKGECEIEGESTCSQPCTLERKYCSHKCESPCHVGKECPDRPCQAKVIIRCQCGRRKEEVLCLATGSSLTSQTFHKLYSGDLSSLMREIQSGQSVKINSVTMKKAQERSLECDEECAQMERNRKLAEALELTDVDHSPHTPPQYCTFLLEQGKIDVSLVIQIEEIFKRLVMTMKEKGSTTSHHFKPMKRPQRRLIHELAEVYLMTSTSYDPEPNRSVVVMATKKSIIPIQALSQTISQVKVMPAPLPVKKLSPNVVSSTANESSQPPPDYFNDSNL